MCLLSIIIPFYQGEKFLPALIRSIERSHQMLTLDILFEVIIVVDSPTTPIKYFNELCLVHYNIPIKISYNQYNIGVARSRDKGLTISEGKYVTFIDQDDSVNTDYFITFQKSLSKSYDILLLNGYIINLDSRKKVPIFYVAPAFKLSHIIADNFIITPSLVIVRKDLVRTIGANFYSSEIKFRGVDDWYFMLQILNTDKKLAIKWCPQKALNYSIHDSNYSHNISEQILGATNVVDVMLKNVKGHFYDLLIRKKKMLEFAKYIYEDGKALALLKYPLRFIIYTFNYTKNINRTIRYIHRRFIGLKIRN
jgi:glycosyltransferase involved in cell wall biosynthesis